MKFDPSANHHLLTLFSTTFHLFSHYITKYHTYPREWKISTLHVKIVGWIYSKFVSKFIYQTHEYMCAMQWRIGVKDILYQSSNYRQIFGKTTLDIFPWNIIGHLSNDGQKLIYALAVLKKTLVKLCE